MASSRWAGAVLAVACGCNLASGLDDFQVDPSTGGAGGGGGGALVAGGAAGVPFAPPCAIEPRDDFEDGLLAAQWSVVSGINNVSEVGGVLTLAVPIGVSDWWAIVGTVERYAVTGCGATVQHIGPLPPEGATNFVMIDAAANRVAFMRVSDTLRCQYKLAADSAVVTVQAQPYDPVAHLWLWLRPLSDATEWYASPDGASWSLLAKSKVVVNADGVQLRLGAGVNAAVVSPGFGVTFDNLNNLP